MSIEAIHYVMKTDIPDGIAKLVAFVIADYAHSETGQAWPKIETVARKCSQSVRTVQRKVRVLEDMGVLRVEQRHTEAGRQRENLFVLYLPGVARPAANDAGPAPAMGDTQSPIPTRKRVDPVTPEGVQSVTPEGDTAVTPRGILQKESPRGILPPPPRGGARSDPGFEFEGGESEGSSSTSDPSGNDLARQGRRSADARRHTAPAPRLAPDAAARFERMWRAYPENGRINARQADVIAAFAPLSAAEQEIAIRTAATVAVRCGEARSQARRIDRWLADGLWANGAPPTAGPAVIAPSDRVFVREGSAEWEAWARYLRGRGRVMPTPTAIGGIEGWRFDSAMPPAEVA